MADTIYDVTLHREVIMEGLAQTSGKISRYLTKNKIRDKKNPLYIMFLDLGMIRRNMITSTTKSEIDNLNIKVKYIDSLINKLNELEQEK